MRRHERWVFAAGAFVAGVALATLAISAGLRVELDGRDFTLAAALVVEAGLALAGFAIGRAVEARAAMAREHEAARRGLEEMTSVQARLARLQRMAAVGELSAMVAHEVRNPLAIIRTMVQNLNDRADGSGDVQRTSQAVLGEIDRLSHVTTMLVGLSRPVEPELSAIDSRLILTRAAWLAERLLDGRPVSLKVQPSGRAPLLGDADLLCQVILELVANALAVTPHGGEIVLGSDVRERTVVLSVSDQGPGIPPDVRDRIFAPFVTSRAGGTGLGLAVARQIVHSQGGTISVHAADGGGARLEITLPRAMPS